MEFVPALTLWILSALRLPTMFDAKRGSVFRATVLAAVACTLYVPRIYLLIDPSLGGLNYAGLLLLLFLLCGFWQFRTAIVLAMVPNGERRRRQVTVGRAAIACAGAAVAVGFFTSRTNASDQNFPLTYGNQPGMAVFLWSGSAFIIWVCFDIARVCRHNVPQMRSRAFRAGFALIGLGCLAFALVLVDRLAYGAVLHNEGPHGADIGALDAFYSIGETLAVLMVSLGLIIVRMPGQLHRERLGFRSRILLIKLFPLWRKQTAQRPDLVLEPPIRNALNTFRRHPETQLHRRVIEIRDCEMARGHMAPAMTPRDLSLLEHAEDVLTRHA